MSAPPAICIACARTGAKPEQAAGRLRLQAEWRWVLTGPDAALGAVQNVLPPAVAERIGSALVLQFGNAVGAFDLPGVGIVDVCSDKWTEADFERMLADVSRVVASLPFWAGAAAQAAHDRWIAREEASLLHRLAYLRHITSDQSPFDDQLLPALRRVVADPHRRLRSRIRLIPIAWVQRVDARTLEDLAAGRGPRCRPRARLRGPLSAVGDHLPETVREPANESTLDVPENRFVKLFLDMCLGVLEASEVWARSECGGSSLSAAVVAEVHRTRDLLGAFRRHRMWEDIGALHAVPVQSTVLQRRYGYRQVLRHYVQLRLAPRIPLSAEDVRRLLEIKNIATLYELWCFFAVVEAVTAIVGRPLDANESLAETAAQGTRLRRGLEVKWPGGVRVVYNPTFSRAAPEPWHSYSLLMRPDIVIETTGPAGPRMDLLDAKFRLGSAARLLPPSECEEEPDDEPGRTCLRDDLNKMHAYRDALPAIRSAWVLYPGDEFRFFPSAPSGSAVTWPGDLPSELDGIGAVPLRPGDTSDVLQNTIRSLLDAKRGSHPR